MIYFEPTDKEIEERIEEELRQLKAKDGKEDVEHPDTQYSDYDETKK